MRKAEVYCNNKLAGILTEARRDHYIFRYDDLYFADNTQPAVSLTLPKTRQEYHDRRLFPFFSNMVAEGQNRAIQCRAWRLDEQDLFGLLLTTASADTIGNVTIRNAEVP